MIELLIALLIYPGIVAIAAGSVVLAFASGTRLPQITVVTRAYHTPQGTAALVSMVLLVLSAVLLPLPLHPAAGRWPVGRIPLVWALIEAAFLIPLLPGFISRLPLAVRASSRAAQLGVAGRAVFWIAAVAGMLTGPGLVELPGRLLALVAGIMALPAAVGLGPFGPEQSLGTAQHPAEFDDATEALLRLLRSMQAMVLVMALAAGVIPPAWVSGGQALIGAGSMIGVVLLVGMALTQFVGRPRLTLPMGLHWCWRRALPLALASLVYTMIV